MNDTNALKNNPSLQRKTAARIAAVQCVYGRLSGDGGDTVESQVARLKKRLANNMNEQKLLLGVKLEPNYTLLQGILEGTLKWQEEINRRVDGVLSKDWSRERMSPVLTAILQCAVFELFLYKNTKHKVLISEYTNIAARFFAEAEVNFVNGVLKNLHAQFHATA